MKKTTTPGENRRQQGRGRPNMKWTDFTKEAKGRSQQALRRAGEDRALRTSLIHRVTKSQSYSMACNTHTHTPQKHRKNCPRGVAQLVGASS